MNQENTQKLLDDFPEMFFEDGRGPNKTSTMHNNLIYCGDGWFDIVYNLCHEIAPMRPKVLQIKEKFAGLRFYCSFPKDYTEKGYDFIRKAEHDAYKTCEECGKPGEMRINNGWRMLKCDQCWEQYKMEHPEEPYP